MGKKRRILFAILVLAVLGGLAWMVLIQRVEPEPVYQGKPLSVWLENYATNNNIQSRQQTEAARMAIQSMGTNAIPTMLRMLRTPNLPWKNWLFALAQKQHVIKIHYVEPQRLYNRARFCFQALGPRAASAVPELVKIYDQNPDAQSYIAVAVGWIGPDAKAAVPSLLRGTASTNHALRNNSFFALGQIHAEPPLVVPVLINDLQDSDPQIRDMAVHGLGDFGTNARPAVPALVKLIESKEPPPPTNPRAPFIRTPNVKADALDALQQIDPEAAAKVSTNLDRDVK